MSALSVGLCAAELEVLEKPGRAAPTLGCGF